MQQEKEEEEEESKEDRKEQQQQQHRSRRPRHYRDRSGSTTSKETHQRQQHTRTSSRSPPPPPPSSSLVSTTITSPRNKKKETPIKNNKSQSNTTTKSSPPPPPPPSSSSEQPQRQPLRRKKSYRRQPSQQQQRRPSTAEVKDHQEDANTVNGKVQKDYKDQVGDANLPPQPFPPSPPLPSQQQLTTYEDTNNFATDFGAFPADFGGSVGSGNSNSNSNSNRNTTNDPFGFDAGMDEGDAEYEPASFAAFNTDFDAGWTNATAATVEETPPLRRLAPPKKVYNTSPIEKPPINQVESSSMKIKWITPYPNIILSSSPSSSSSSSSSKTTTTKKGKQLPPPAVANPLTGNLIVSKQFVSSTCSSNYDILEWDPQTRTQIMGMPILTSDLIRTVVHKYRVTPKAVDTVWTVRAGVHYDRDAQKYCVRVAALVDLTILGDRNHEVLRIIAIWNWGYYSNSDSSRNSSTEIIALQAVISPPSGSDFSYDTTSLVVADDCIFIAGASSNKGPCVFLSKPTIRETWSANFVGKNTKYHISHMATLPSSSSFNSNNDGSNNNDRFPYIAIALTDGTLSVWTYEAATKLHKNSTETVRRLLFPFCRLDTNKGRMKSFPITRWNSSKEQQQSQPDGDNITTATANDNDNDGVGVGIGFCTHLEWTPLRASSYQQLLIVAASFQGALGLYHVALPKVKDRKRGTYHDIKTPTEKTTLGSTYIIKPFCLSKWISTYHKTTCSFVDLGTHIPPSLVVLLTGLKSNSDYARIALVTCPLPSHNTKPGGGSGNQQHSQLAFHELW